MDKLASAIEVIDFRLIGIVVLLLLAFGSIYGLWQGGVWKRIRRKRRRNSWTNPVKVAEGVAARLPGSSGREKFLLRHPDNSEPADWFQTEIEKAKGKSSKARKGEVLGTVPVKGQPFTRKQSLPMSSEAAA